MTERSNDIVTIGDYLVLLLEVGINVPSDVLESLNRLKAPNIMARAKLSASKGWDRATNT